MAESDFSGETATAGVSRAGGVRFGPGGLVGSVAGFVGCSRDR